MWKVLTCLHRTARGGLRASVREDQQGVTLRSLKSESGPSRDVPHFVVPGLQVDKSSESVSPHTRRREIQVNAFFLKHREEKSRFEDQYNGGYENWNILEAYQYALALVLVHNFVHIKEEFPRELCPHVFLRQHKSVHAQPVTTFQHADQAPAIDHKPDHDEPCNVTSNQLQLLSLQDNDLTTKDYQHSIKHKDLDQFSLKKVPVELTETPGNHHLTNDIGCEQNFESISSKHKETPLEVNKETRFEKQRTKKVTFAESELELELSAIEGIVLLEAGDLRSITLLQELSSKGSSVADFHLGMAYESGFLVKQNMVMARKYYEKSARNGNPDAEYNLAVFYIHGLGGLESDLKKALQLIEKAERGGSDAAFAFMSRRRSHKSTASNTDEVSDRNSDGTNAEHMYELGRSFENLGEMREALRFYTMASDHGCGKAREARHRLYSGSGSV